MRLDKYLKVSRLIKRRTVANEACDAGRVMINGKTAKAGTDVKVGDVIEIWYKKCQGRSIGCTGNNPKRGCERVVPLFIKRVMKRQAVSYTRSNSRCWR